jgi:hypothetical protein
MFKIIKKTPAVWQHELNGQIIHLSSFGVVADISLQTFILRALNGSYFPQQSVGIADIIVIDETDGSVEETFGTINELLNRLVELNYTPYIDANGISMNLQQVTDNGATTTNPIVVQDIDGKNTYYSFGLQHTSDDDLNVQSLDFETPTTTETILIPNESGTMATREWVDANVPVAVESVNSQTGIVVLDADDISDSATTNKFVTSAEKTTWNGKQDALVSGTNIKTIEGVNILGGGDLGYFNQLSFEQNIGYITPNVGNTTYTGIRTTNSNSQTGQNAEFGYPARMLYASATTLGAFATQRGTVGGNFIQNFNLKLYWKRRFQIDCNISGSRFVCGLSNMFQLASPTNVEPDTLINTIGVCKLSTSNNLHFFWNDATGLATMVDLGVNYPANNVTAYYYDLEIYKESGTANITLKLTRIDASGNRISTSQVVSTNYNSGIIHSPVIYGTNNATASSFRFYDYGLIFKHYNSQWNTI